MPRVIPTICVSFLNDENSGKVIINKSDFDEKLHKIKRVDLTNDETSDETYDETKVETESEEESEVETESDNNDENDPPVLNDKVKADENFEVVE